MKRSLLLRLLLISGITFFTFSLFAQVVINEYSASNYNYITDNFSQFEDWIELYNTSDSFVDLEGYYLSDRKDNPTKWKFPSSVIIPPKSYRVVWASGRDVISGNHIHTNFKLTQTREKEDIVFSDPTGNILDIQLMDKPSQVNQSWARVSDGADDWGIIVFPTFGAENLNVRPGYIAKPSISPAAGFYEGESIEITITHPDPNASIYYTLNGIEPDDNSTQYKGPFRIEGNVVLQAIAYSNNNVFPKSFINFRTYFVGTKHTMKVISMSGEDLPRLMAGAGGGFQGLGNEPTGNFELFDEKGERVSDATGVYNKHGNDSWSYSQRGVDFVTHDQFGYDYAVKHNIFKNTDRDKFQRLILKAAANDNYPFEEGGAHIRDAYIHELSHRADLEMDERTYEPCVIYMNGEYWGVYEIREKVDDHDFTDYYYDQGEFDIDFIKTWGGTWEEYGSSDEWYELLVFIESNNMANPEKYAYVEERLDINSMIDYIILHAHNVSTDWLNWNTAWWRGRNPAGGAQKWRYILWDEDATFGHYINYTEMPSNSFDATPCDIENPMIDDPERHLQLFSDLYKNPNFKAQYINRYADLNNTFFSCDYMVPLLDEMINRLRPEMPLHFARWGGEVSEWQNNISQLRNFITDRCTIIDESIADCYEDDGITGPYDVLINVEPALSGNVKINTALGTTYPWATTYYGGIEIALTALPSTDYVFSHWEVNNNTFSENETNAAISMKLISGDEITAHFASAIPCDAPINISVDALETSAYFNWEDASEAISYELRYRALEAIEWNLLTINESEYQLQGLEPCLDYEVELRTICPQGISSAAYFTFVSGCETPLSIQNLSNLSNFKISPNPFKKDLEIEFELLRRQNVVIEILSINGQIIDKQDKKDLPVGENRIKLKINEVLSSGTYILRCLTEKGVIMRKIVKL